MVYMINIGGGSRGVGGGGVVRVGRSGARSLEGRDFTSTGNNGSVAATLC